ncbi:RagB/SusD family nutrient uptake outer membrane protein [Hyunsoonleella ulvae]|uniref:RagB/SusD family nutrient uptake outer membrane protein n=1 Tax=Hyunsoonleella ulvae TaxID=2799948 RepID=UPI00193A9E2E|nr:RagB/SusD family nutrient uptake outer membrane protein [Hyunsoonleella ulvae]
MKNTFKLSSAVIVILISILSVSCNDEVAVKNTNDLSRDSFFESLAQIEASANAAYAQLQNTGLYQRYGYILPDTFSDESQSGGDPNFVTSFNFSLTPSLEQVTRFWNNCYNGIGACNFVIEGEATMRERLVSGNFTEADIEDAVGQAHFLRGLFYFFLVKRYGGVPLLLESQATITPQPRSTADEVYDVIINEFKLASELLYAKGATENGRATSGAAMGMLGKVYLHREMYREAQQTFAQITDYSLLPLEDYVDNFNDSGEYNDESLFEVSFNGDATEQDLWSQTGIGVSEVTFHAQEYTAWGNLNPSRKLMDEFEEDDPRLNLAILQNGVPYGPNFDLIWNQGNIRWFKFSQLYDNSQIQQNGSTNARVLRYADIVLMQAEVEHKLGNDEGAVDFLNQIRARVEMPLYGTPEMDAAGFPVDTPSGVFDAIVHERMIELCGEQVRFDDLVRWNLDAQEITVNDFGQSRGYNPNVHRLMPIPQVEIDTNDGIGPEDQNPGY